MNTLQCVGARATRPLMSLGIISDVQYADIDDKYNYSKTKMRHYRQSLVLMRRAVKYWKDNGVTAILQLGDVIDGFGSQTNQSESNLLSIFNELKSFPGEVMHCIGNHELYNFPRASLATSELCARSISTLRQNACENNSTTINQNHSNTLESNLSKRTEKLPKEKCLPECVIENGAPKFYYSTMIGDICVVCLDTYEIGMLGQERDSDVYKKSEEFLRSKNPSRDLNAPDELKGLNKRFLKFSGGVSREQIVWLEQQLKSAVERKQNVIIISHVPVCPEAADPMCLCWNYEDVMDVLNEYSECVVCFMAGHDHDGASAVDSTGILHITWPGVVESEDADAFATANIYTDRIDLVGTGMYPSYDVKLRYNIIEKVNV